LLLLTSCAPVAFDVTARSHAVINAYDHGDAAVVGAALAPGFVHFEGGRPRDRDAMLARMHDVKTTPMAQRTFSNEHAYVVGDDAVFIGQAAERGGGNRGSYLYDGYYALAWHREHGDWRLAMWTWQRAGERDFWNDVFTHDVGFEHAPNKLLVDAVANVPPGDALDVLMGQGRNALYLASRGWRVTGVDWSHEGIAHAQAEATKRGLALDTVDADIARFDLGTAKWDLVTLVYASGFDQPDQLAKVRQAIKPGGLVVIEYFGKTAAAPTGFEPGQLRRLFGDAFEVLRDEAVDDTPDWATDRAPLVRFVARKR
jgi:SAM-dependent methyltransferase